MSYLFDGSDDRLTGSFSSTYAIPVTLACWFKQAAHPLVVDFMVNLGNSSSATPDSVCLRTDGADDTYQIRSNSTTSGGQSANIVKAGIDGVWTPIVGAFVSTTERHGSVGGVTGTNGSTSAMAGALQHIAIAQSLASGGRFAGYLAEIAMWDKELTAQEILDYEAGNVPSSIAAANLIGYWSLNANGVLTNAGLDAGGDLTATGGPTFDADHPVIVSGSLPGRSRLMGGLSGVKAFQEF